MYILHYIVHLKCTSTGIELADKEMFGKTILMENSMHESTRNTDASTGRYRSSKILEFPVSIVYFKHYFANYIEVLIVLHMQYTSSVECIENKLNLSVS